METDTKQPYQSYSDEDRRIVSELRLIDDIFMATVLARDIKAAQLVVRTILGRDDINIVKIIGQDEIKNLMRHDVRLDIHAIDDTGVNYDLEIQRSDRGAVPQRTRYNGDLMDMTMLEKGADYSELKKSYVIFITENDYFKAGEPLYHIDKFVRETGNLFDDGAYTIYVNSQYRGNDAIGKLMHDFYCKEAKDMHYMELAEGVRYFKESEEGVESMCRIVEEATEKRSRDAIIRIWDTNGCRNTKTIAYWFSITVEKVELILGPTRLKQAKPTS